MTAAASLDAAQRQQVYDDNWMMRGYAEQLKKRGLALSPELNSLLVADPNAPKSPTPPDSLLAQPATAKKMIPLRPTSSLLGDRGLLTPKKSLVNGPFQPLVSPIYDPGTSYKDPWASTASLEDDMASLANNSGASLLPVPGSNSGRRRAQDRLGAGGQRLEFTSGYSRPDCRGRRVPSRRTTRSPSRTPAKTRRPRRSIRAPAPAISWSRLHQPTTSVSSSRSRPWRSSRPPRPP